MENCLPCPKVHIQFILSRSLGMSLRPQDRWQIVGTDIRCWPTSPTHSGVGCQDIVQRAILKCLMPLSRTDPYSALNGYWSGADLFDTEVFFSSSSTTVGSIGLFECQVNFRFRAAISHARQKALKSVLRSRTMTSRVQPQWCVVWMCCSCWCQYQVGRCWGLWHPGIRTFILNHASITYSFWFIYVHSVYPISFSLRCPRTWDQRNSTVFKITYTGN